MIGKEACVMALNNMKGKKKSGRALGVMIFFALFIYLFINSVAMSVNDVVALFDEIPMARNIIYEDREGDLAEKFKNIKDEVEHVVDVYPYVYVIPTGVSGIEDDEDVFLELQACSDGYEEYIVEGRLPGEGEIMLPHYMFAVEEGQYVDGSRYIGDELTIRVTNHMDEERSVKLVVSGTYDNIYSVMGTCTALVSTKEAVGIYDLTEEGWEEKLAEEMEKTGNHDKDCYIGFEKQYYYAVVVDDAKYINEVRGSIGDKYNVGGLVELNSDYNVLETVFPVIHLVCVGISMVLLVVVIFIMISMVGNDINSRRKEMAIYMVQGYLRADLLKILGVEYAARLVPSLIFSVLATIAGLFAGNVIIEKFMTMEFKILELDFSIKGLVAALIMLLIVWAVAEYTVNDKLKKIDVQKEIKSEG